MEQNVEQLCKKFSPAEFRTKKSVFFSETYISLIFIKIDTLKNQLVKISISLTKFKKWAFSE